MMVGIAGMVFGTIITITVLILQFSFTSVYTYMDLIQWAKGTHKRIVDETERAKLEALKKEEEAKKSEESKPEGAQ